MTHIAFISGTRADYGKIRPYIDFLAKEQKREVSVFITGMNMLKKYGSTFHFMQKDLKKIAKIVLDKSFKESSSSQEMAHIIQKFDKFLKKEKIDFVFVHGDRPEVLAASSCAVLNNIPVCHIEAGDISGSVDELIRHATSKLSHKFLVADEAAKNTLIQLGEDEKNIYITGNSSLAYTISPLTKKEKKLVQQFENYGILIYHPVTTLSKTDIKKEISKIMTALSRTKNDYVVILPNNDLGSDTILATYEEFKTNPKFHFFKSLSFEAFNYLLRNAKFLIGNSSCGIKEAPFYQTPVIDIGTRQKNRYNHLKLNNFYHIDSPDTLEETILQIKQPKTKTILTEPKVFFEKLHAVFTDEFFNCSTQKTFIKQKK